MSMATIIDLLEQQGDLQEKLLAVSHNKRKAIIESDTVRLNEIVTLELKALHRMNSLEKKRVELIHQIAKSQAVEEAEITVSRLAEMTDGEERTRLLSLRDRLSKLLHEQKQLNAMNRDLLEVHMDYTDLMLNLIVGPEDPLNHIYGAGGYAEGDDRKSSGLFDTQI